MSTVTSARLGRSALPWLVRLGVGVGCLALVIAKDVGEYGLERDGDWGLSRPMGLAILVAGVVAAFPFGVVEGFFARRGTRLWLQCVAAAAGAAVVGWFAALPVGLRFFASTDPARQEFIEMAVSSFLLMAAAHSLLVLLMRSHRPGVRSRR